VVVWGLKEGSAWILVRRDVKLRIWICKNWKRCVKRLCGVVDVV
jgi:hypothetical protein